MTNNFFNFLRTHKEEYFYNNNIIVDMRRVKNCTDFNLNKIIKIPNRFRITKVSTIPQLIKIKNLRALTTEKIIYKDVVYYCFEGIVFNSEWEPLVFFDNLKYYDLFINKKCTISKNPLEKWVLKNSIEVQAKGRYNVHICDFSDCVFVPTIAKNTEDSENMIYYAKKRIKTLPTKMIDELFFL